MRVSIVGGGPAGLYFGILALRRGLADSVTVYERNRPDATFGWGIVFSGATLRHLEAADPESCAVIREVAATWEKVVVLQDGHRTDVAGNDFVGVERLTFLHALQRRAAGLGVDVRYEHEVDDPAALAGASDLLIGADGVGSVVRRTWADAFQPTLDERHNHYIWLGTEAVFDGLTMAFRRAPEGTFIAHAYSYSPELSTFVVECDPDTFSAAALGAMGEADALEYLADVFREDLGGAPLLARDARWVRFIHLTNQQWQHENVALLGDALHTAHFSIGSGTKLALEDAIALADALEEPAGVREALAAWQRRRSPAVAAYQEAALRSLRWLEDLGDDLSLPPIRFAYLLMTRSGRVSDESIRRRDPEFAAAYEAWCETEGRPAPGSGAAPPTP